MTVDPKWYPKSWQGTIIIILSVVAVLASGFTVQKYIDSRAEAAVNNCSTLTQIKADTTELKRDVKFQRCALAVHMAGGDANELLKCEAHSQGK